MSELKVQMSGGGGGRTAEAGHETALQQPKDAVLMKSWDRSEGSRVDDGAGPSLGRNDGAASYKGKERALDDNLSIEITDAPNSPDNPVCTITLLLPTGARHPYRIDEKYLAKRGVDIPDVTDGGKRDPFSISIYKLKELILREWRDDWDIKPASPSSIRLIHFGKLLDDKEQLKKYQFSAESPNVVHMSVRPAEMLDEDEAAKGKSSTREGRNREGGSGCCTIL